MRACGARERRQGDLAVLVVEVMPELIFDASFPFARIVEADADGDGTLSVEELRAFPVVATTSASGISVPPTAKADMLTALAGRSGSQTLRLRTK